LLFIVRTDQFKFEMSENVEKPMDASTYTHRTKIENPNRRRKIIEDGCI